MGDYKFLQGNFKVEVYLEDLGVDGEVILNWNLKSGI
jgi:hypothetical protein